MFWDEILEFFLAVIVEFKWGCCSTTEEMSGLLLSSDTEVFAPPAASAFVLRSSFNPSCILTSTLLVQVLVPSQEHGPLNSYR